MARSSARCSFCQNPLFDGKDEFAGKTPTKGSNCRTTVCAAIHAPTPAVAPAIAPLAPFGSANSSVVRYLEDDLQRILRTVLDSKLPTPVPAPIVATALHYEGPRERLLKARFLDVYWGKTHMECYNFFQQFEEHFAIAGATGPNRVPFAATFLKDTALFRWQQSQRKVKDEINVSTT